MSTDTTRRHGGPRPGAGRTTEGDVRGIRIPDELWTPLGHAAAEDATTRSALVRQAVTELLERRERRLTRQTRRDQPG